MNQDQQLTFREWLSFLRMAYLPKQTPKECPEIYTAGFQNLALHTQLHKYRDLLDDPPQLRFVRDAVRRQVWDSFYNSVLPLLAQHIENQLSDLSRRSVLIFSFLGLHHKVNVGGSRPNSVLDTKDDA